MRDLAVLIPTRGRPGNVRKVISAWDFTNAWDCADMVLVIDQDDPEYPGYLALVEETQHPDSGGPLIKTYQVPAHVPMVHKLNDAACALAPGWFALGFAGDDHLPQTIGWAARYLATLRELGTGMVYGDDGYQGVKLSTEWAMTSDVVCALGRMVPAPVEHMFCDNAVLELFTAARAVRHLPEVRIEHRNPYAGGKASMDDQYKRVNSRDQMSRDRRAYQSWQRSTLAEHVAAVRSLRAGRPEERPTRRPVRTARRQGGKLTMRPPRFFKRVRAATPEDVMMTLADLAVQVPADQEIVEIGVFHGRTALQLAWGARQGSGAHVTGIDPWDLQGNTYGPPFTDASPRRWAHHHVKTLGYGKDITLVQGFSHEVAAKWVDDAGEHPKPVGLLFVDGDHSKEGARRDIEAWAPHLADGARIAVDDYGHPDWPGVKEAVDEMVAEGLLEPVEVFHDQLAVTRLATTPSTGPTTAVTSEGVHPSPHPAADGQVADPFDQVGQAARLFDQGGQSSDDPLGDYDRREFVQKGELDDLAVRPGTPIEDLTIAQMKALAKVRGIVLGVRKDKRAEIIEALKDGR